MEPLGCISMQMFTALVNDRAEITRTPGFYQISFEKEHYNSFAFSFCRGPSWLLGLSCHFQVLLGRIPLKTIPPVFLIHQIDFITLIAPVIKRQEQREQTYLIIDAVIPVKVSSLPWKNVDVNMLKK